MIANQAAKLDIAGLERIIERNLIKLVESSETDSIKINSNTDINEILSRGPIGYNGNAAEFISLLSKDLDLSRSQLDSIRKLYGCSISLNSAANKLYELLHGIEDD